MKEEGKIERKPRAVKKETAQLLGRHKQIKVAWSKQAKWWQAISPYTVPSRPSTKKEKEPEREREREREREILPLFDL